MSELSNLLDLAEVELNKYPRVEIPTEHAMAFGFYIRKVVMPAGSVITTKTHGVKSPYCVSRGKCLIKSMDGDETQITGPHIGITEPGTRRIIYVIEETEWTTFQPVDSGQLSEIIDNFEAQIMIPKKGFVSYADSLNRQSPELHDERTAIPALP